MKLDYEPGGTWNPEVTCQDEGVGFQETHPKPEELVPGALGELAAS